MKIHQQSETSFVFHCPGCKCAHGFNSTWTWNNDFDKPTVSPSLLSIGEKKCHLFIRDGKLQFLSDCEHELKNQTIDIPNWENENI